MSPSIRSLAVLLLVSAGVLLVVAAGIPVAEALDWHSLANSGYVGLLLAFAGSLCAALGGWLRMAGPRAAAKTRTLTHLTLWVAIPLVFAGCLAHGVMQVWEMQHSMNEA